jgi:hypothetical protein
MGELMGSKKGNKIFMDSIVKQGCCEIDRLPVAHGIRGGIVNNINREGISALNTHAIFNLLDNGHDLICMGRTLNNIEPGASTPHNKNKYEAQPFHINRIDLCS